MANHVIKTRIIKTLCVNERRRTRRGHLISPLEQRARAYALFSVIQIHLYITHASATCWSATRNVDRNAHIMQQHARKRRYPNESIMYIIERKEENDKAHQGVHSPVTMAYCGWRRSATSRTAKSPFSISPVILSTSSATQRTQIDVNEPRKSNLT